MSHDVKNIMIILSSPSGVGKTTLTKKIQQKNQSFKISVSHTTRTPRSNEVDGVDYYFITKSKFEELINKKKFYDEFLEQLKNFDFNNAHCFSPQEEMKLRKIMHDIGKKKLEEIKDEIRNMLEGKMKDRNIWCACSDTTGKDSTEETLSSTHNPVNEPAIEEGIELGNVREV